MITIKVGNIKSVLSNFNLLNGVLSQEGQQKWANEKLQPIIQDSIKENFDSEGGKVGGWKKLTESTKASRKRPGAKILIQTGNLKTSAIKRGSIPNITKTGDGINAIFGKSIGTGKEGLKFAVHQFGIDSSGNKGGRLPARKMIAITTEDVKKITGSVGGWIRQHGWK